MTETPSPQTPPSPYSMTPTAAHRLPMGVLDLQLDAVNPRRAYAACMDGVYQLDLDAGNRQRLYEHASYATGIVHASRRNQLISAGYDGQLIWYDLNRRAVFRRLRAHSFWSWNLALSADEQRLASVTGQYLAGSIDYQPRPASEPTVKVFDAASGDLQYALSLDPPVQCVAFSHDSRFVAAGNLMGQTRVWDLADGQLASQWTTDGFTGWGITKSHCYVGGIYALTFSPDNAQLVLAGMGPMRDPMAGNGKQRWQRFAWQDAPPRQIDQTDEAQAGEGLMETLAWHESGQFFLMAGRQRGGDWNAALFAADNGERLSHISTGFRITSAQFNGSRVVVAGAGKQKEPNDTGVYPPFGRVQLFDVQVPEIHSQTRRQKSDTIS